MTTHKVYSTEFSAAVISGLVLLSLGLATADSLNGFFLVGLGLVIAGGVLTVVLLPYELVVGDRHITVKARLRSAEWEFDEIVRIEDPFFGMGFRIVGDSRRQVVAGPVADQDSLLSELKRMGVSVDRTTM